MDYIKLIALSIGDLYSSIFFEDNYSLDELDIANKQKEELEKDGYFCILANTTSNIKVK